MILITTTTAATIKIITTINNNDNNETIATRSYQKYLYHKGIKRANRDKMEKVQTTKGNNISE